MDRGSRAVMVFSACIVILFCSGCLAPPSGTPGPAPPIHPPMPRSFTSLLSMQEDLSPGMTLSLPRDLPWGFVFSGGTQVRCTYESTWSDGEIGLRYSRGDETLLLTESPSGRTPCPGERGCPPNRTGEDPVFTGGSRSNSLRWESRGICLLLEGTLPEDELRAIAGSISPAPYVTGVHPPYDYVKPADPFVGTITPNLSVTGRNVTVTVESLECTPEACTVRIRTTVPSPATLPPPPGGSAPPLYPDPHAVWRVDDGRPLLTVQAIGYRPEGDGTLLFWSLEPIPADSSRLTMNMTRFREIEGPWELSIPLIRQ